MAGIWTSVPALASGETWLHHTIFNYPGIISFLVMDAAIFIAAATLLTVQASQVKYMPFFFISFLFPITVEKLTFGCLLKDLSTFMFVFECLEHV